ncbi:Eyes absent 2 [Orchesella cincta]|uniref:Eyes absent 2 n=1 Tax=Orchesella cincta TaxID=48709 RepID=A0A1D2MNU2_ORCCI|nr:Eyes absent 2 [Orchesella cincta]
MASLKFSITVALFATVALLFQVTAASKSIKRDISELTPVEKLLLRVTHPELYNSWFGRSTNKIPDEYSPFDFLNFDLPTLALQLSKSDGALILPSLTYSYGFYFCYIGVCAGFNQDYDFRNPEVVNANLTSLNTKINSTNIELDLKIPDLQIRIDNFTLYYTDLVNGGTEYWKGFSFTITNYTLQLTADLEYTPDVGIQVSNVAMNFDVDDFGSIMGYEEGNVEEIQYAEQMKQDWVEIGADVESVAELWLNCFLKEDVFLNFLLDFPTPTINSILVDFSTLMLQLGKLLYYRDYNEFPIEGFTLSYDKTRENCTDGVCRSINQKMVLPEWVYGGVSDNRVQLDIEATSFSYSLKVPHVYLNSDMFQYELTDVDNGYKEVYLAVFSEAFRDTAFALTGNYEFKEGVGIQVSDTRKSLLRLGRTSV